MSASSKKKLRAEENAAKLTERQLTQRKEDKKTRLYTIGFVAVLIALVVIAATIGVTRAVANSGIRERKTVAAYVDDIALNNEDLGYFFVDSVNSFYSQNNAYLALYGLDTSAPLDQQVYNQETGETWADYFLNSAAENAKAMYALNREAEANGYQLPQEAEEQIESAATNIELYAKVYGFSKAEDYLKAMYGKGASLAGYQKYLRTNLVASNYQQDYVKSLSYSDEELTARDNENPLVYNGYSFHQYYVSASRYLDENASAEEKRAAAEADAKALIAEEIRSPEDLDKAIAALAVNADTEVASSAMESTRYTSLNSTVSDWISDSARKSGDKTYLPNITTTTDENGQDVETVAGYYVLFYQGSSDNRSPLVNVRHILVSLDNGTEATEEEKAEARKEAEELLTQWKQGEATEDSFAALASEHTDDPGSQETGGLYENVYPGQMVSAFNNWCFDSHRQNGDTDIVETSYGYHVMYFVGQSAENYRQYLIRNDLQNEAYSDWYNTLLEGATLTMGDTSYIRTDLILNSNG